MTTPVEFTPFILGAVIGVILSVALAVRGISLWTAAGASIAILYLFADGGQEAIIELTRRIAAHLKEASETGLVGGVLVGKMAASVLRGIKRPT